MKHGDRERLSFHRAEEQRHAEHAARREQARDDGTLSIEAGEAMLSEIRRRREVKRLEDALRDAQEQISEVK